MGLLRLINASRLARSKKLLAEVRSGAPTGGAGAGTARMSAALRAFERDATPRPSSRARSLRACQPSLHDLPKHAVDARPCRFAAKPAADAPMPRAYFVPLSNSASCFTGCGSPFFRGLPGTGSGANASHRLTEGTGRRNQVHIQSQQKFLGEILEHGIDGSLKRRTAQFIFAVERTYAEMLEGRDSIEQMRSVSSKVLGTTGTRLC